MSTNIPSTTGPDDSTNAQAASAKAIPDAAIVAPAEDSNTGDSPKSPKGEDALEEGEILELQAFIPRREWIEDKIKFLETLPPVDLFSNLEFLVNASPTPIPGLPTREELAEWMKQHDAIEQEAERFDSNDMKRLKKFAKAATQRNLSPADTDLIEVTLTTLLALDKLVHLLRSRSEFLELTGLRLTWEEKRLGAWAEHQSIQEDIEAFVKKSARWTPEAYRRMIESLVNVSTSSVSSFSMHHTNASNASGSIMSHPNASTSSVNASTNFDSPLSSPVSATTPGRRNSAFSSNNRNSRSKVGDDLGREAGRFTTRIAAWDRGLVKPAGQALDKMIDKKTVPDSILDEQDRLEDKTRPLEALARFGMEVVAQWKKADEIYGNLKKEQDAAGSLREEIMHAIKHHPDSEMDSSFVTRLQGMNQRITTLTTAVNSRLFPKPTHPRFPDQAACNDSIVSTLSSELKYTKSLIQEAAAVSQQYHERNQLVGQVENAQRQLEQYAVKLESCAKRLQEGAEAEDGDGTPIRLDSVDCLEPMRHGAYLAVLPIICGELEEACNLGDNAARICRRSMVGLKDATLDPAFSESTDKALESFTKAKERAIQAKEAFTSKAAALREARKVWAAVGDAWTSLDEVKATIASHMERDKWHPMGQEQPLRSPMREDGSWSTTFQRIPSQLDEISANISNVVLPSIKNLDGSVGSDVVGALGGATTAVQQYLDNVRGMCRLHETVKNQAKAMDYVQTEEMSLEKRIDTMMPLFEEYKNALGSTKHPLHADVEAQDRIAGLLSDHDSIKESVVQLCDGLVSRVPFIGKPDAYFHGPLRSAQPTLATFLQTWNPQVPPTPLPFMLPLDANALDHNVRSDANHLVIRITTKSSELSRYRDYLELALAARQVEKSASSLQNELRTIQEEVDAHASKISSVAVDAENADIDLHRRAMEQFETSLKSVESASNKVKEFTSQAIPPFRDSLRDLLGRPGAQDPDVQQQIIDPCVQKERELGSQLNEVASALEGAASAINFALNRERAAIETLERLAEEARRKAELEEQQRVAEQLRLEEERKAALAREEEERLRREEEERLREAERVRREEEEAEKARKAAEEEARLAAIREEEERLKMLAKQLEDEQRRIAEEQELARQRDEAERLEREAEMQRQLALEQKRLADEAEERKRREEEEREARRLQEEEQERQRILKEQELQRLIEQEHERQRQLKAEEEARRQEEEARRIAEEEARRRAEEEEARRRAEEEEARRRAEEEEARRRAEEEKTRLEEEARRIAEEEARRRAEEEEARRAEEEAQRIAEEEELRRQALKQEEEAREQERLRLEAEREEARIAEEARLAEIRLAEERRLAQEASASSIEDVFARAMSKEAGGDGPASTFEQIEDLRRRLRGLSLENWVTPIPDSAQASVLPTKSYVAQSEVVFDEISSTFRGIPTTMDDSEVQESHQTLHKELEHARELLDRCRALSVVSSKAAECDASLSDLLEHVDGYPSAPIAELQSPHVSDPSKPPEEQLAARLAYTQNLVQEFEAASKPLSSDGRVAAETERLDQTWTELQEMCTDRLQNKSRPSTASGHGFPSGRGSSMSSRSNSSAPSGRSTSSLRAMLEKTPVAKKKKDRESLGLGRSPRPSATMPVTTPRQVSRTVSKTHSGRTASVALNARQERLEPKLAKKRSVSGPLVSPNSSLHQSTFSSRQRTASNTLGLDPVTPTKPSYSGSRSPFKTPKGLRPPSPDLSETSSIQSKGRSVSAHSRISGPSFGKPPPRPPASKSAVRKPYVANPKNKLDVAVGNVVNKMAVNVPIQAVTSSGWEDKSGKYWIGDDEEARLCFCRILRSQTVMVRVGGGWCELSKFLKDHFAHLLDQIPDAPSLGSKEQKWISSATLNTTTEEPLLELPILQGPRPPKTPEPRRPSGAVVVLHTPNGTSPRSLHSSGSPGSPLAPLQFIRKAEESPHRSGTTPPPHRLSKSTTSRTPARIVSTTPVKPPTWRM